ncbi:unnamed protein product [Cylicostephanus goldi]|uniref:Uncharacterized protein n=1 Tax=Cylicostephanus goldi TaxID=71465 RepID=A0A3P7RAS0_CYLGO|nr:unnamed protein product [Cylicostephanus goldi]
MDEPKEMPTKSIFREVRDWFRARTRRELIAMGLGAALATFTTIVVVRRYREAPPEPVVPVPTRLIATTPPHRIRSLPPPPVSGASKATRLPSAPPVTKTSVPEKVQVDKGSISRPQPARRRNRSMSRTGTKEGIKTAQNVPSKEGMKTAQDMATARKDTSGMKTAREERKK